MVKALKSKTSEPGFPELTAASVKSVISLKITLRDTKPPIWRRILVPDTIKLGDLHKAIQRVMGWHNSHLHLFEIEGRQYSDPSMLDDAVSENRMTLQKIMKSGVTRFDYIYDFGDSWDHSIVIEKSVPAVEGKSYPACVAGKRKWPPEDCGGPWGYEHLLEVLSDPAHAEYAELNEWVGEKIDPEDFSVAKADAALAAHFGR